MDALHFIREMLSEPALREFIKEMLSEPVHRKLLSNLAIVEVNSLNLIVLDLINVQIFMTTTKFRGHPEGEKQALIENLRLTACKLGNFMSEIFGPASRKQSSISGSHDLDLVNDCMETLKLINGIIASCNKLKQTEPVREFMHRVKIPVLLYYDMETVKNNFLEGEDSSNCITLVEEQHLLEFLLINAVPSLVVRNENYEKSKMLLEVSTELENLPQQIIEACEKKPLLLILVGSLLSLKVRTSRTWEKVKDDLCKIKNLVTNNHMCHIFTCCYDDLPYFLKPCFLYLACYSIGYTIPGRSLTEMWIAEGFIKPKKGETMEEAANKYLEQLVQRSLVWVTKRSFLGTIKHCRVPRSLHEFAIKQSCKDGLVANSDKEKMVSLFRFAIHHDDKNQYMEVIRDVLVSPLFLSVLELRRSEIPYNLKNMIYLRYLALRGSNISEIPKNIDNTMRNLQTLDVRDTKIVTLPESLWNIPALCNVYVNPGPEIKGPPPTAPIPNLQTLKTVVVPESWLEYNLDFPWQGTKRDFLFNLRKIGLLIVNNLQWKCVSNLLNHMVKLHSMKLLGNGDINIPSEYVDARAFPVLETVKSLKCEGKLNYRKLPIDNIKISPNLLKLTLIKSDFKEDPMLFLEKLQFLKFLSLQDGAYTGKKMVCSANGFPQLRFIELFKLENLEFWEVEPIAMAQLTTMRVVHCQKLDDLPDLEHVTNIITDIFTRNPESYPFDDPNAPQIQPEPDLSLAQLEPISTSSNRIPANIAATGLNRSVSELDPNLPLTNLPKLEPLSDTENEYLNIEEESVQAGLEDEPSFRV